MIRVDNDVWCGNQILAKESVQQTIDFLLLLSCENFLFFFRRFVLLVNLRMRGDLLSQGQPLDLTSTSCCCRTSPMYSCSVVPSWSCLKEVSIHLEHPDCQIKRSTVKIKKVLLPTRGQEFRSFDFRQDRRFVAWISISNSASWLLYWNSFFVSFLRIQHNTWPGFDSIYSHDYPLHPFLWYSEHQVLRLHYIYCCKLPAHSERRYPRLQIVQSTVLYHQIVFPFWPPTYTALGSIP